VLEVETYNALLKWNRPHTGHVRRSIARQSDVFLQQPIPDGTPLVLSVARDTLSFVTVSLFDELTLRGVTIPNRIWLAPMCQYSCLQRDGVPTDWHLVHLGARATGGFGLVMSEAAAVSPEGRISPEDAGIWNDTQADAWSRITAFVTSQGAVPAVQLAHAGRKGSTYSFWHAAGSGSVPAEEGGWTTVGPSTIPFEGYLAPEALSVEAIQQIVTDFVAAAERADRAGFEVVELHAAHGYLLHEFLSPLSNARTDAYGGSLENRARLLTEIVTGVREVLPPSKPLFVRFSGTDWVEGGWTVHETSQVARWVADLGVDLVDLSSGGNAAAQIPVGPGYQVPLAAQVHEESGVPTAAVGLITEPAQAAEIVASGKADAVMLARAALREPSWPQRAAHDLGLSRHDTPYPPQYTRGAWPQEQPAVRSA
jgi:2,4-dienoyl-CoA reductase-like NADH-dependent reductase (Old Yellow Enzyme family)